MTITVVGEKPSQVLDLFPRVRDDATQHQLMARAQHKLTEECSQKLYARKRT